MSVAAVNALLRSHPEQISHADALGKCIEACLACMETCTACADACLAEREISKFVSCIRLNHDCAAVCAATANVLSRANKVGHRQLLEAQLTACIAFCRTCAAECARHASMHKHCDVCAKTCQLCAVACTDMLASMRMPA